MICPKCGSEIRDGLTFCPKCGAEFGNRNQGVSRTRTIDGEPVEVDVTEELSTNHDGYRYENSNGSWNNNFNGFEPRRRFYQKTWFIILALIFFWPLGIFLMWKFSKWNKIVKIIISILCLFALIGLFTGNDDTKSSDNDTQIETEAVETEDNADATKEEATEETDTTKAVAKDANSIKMRDGFDKLQSFYLQINDSYTEAKIKKIAKENGLYCETIDNYPIYSLDISATETTGYGPGAEPWYQFNTDSIHISMTKDDENEADDNYYAFSKDYYVQDQFMSVNYTFYDKELYVDNDIPGYAERGKKDPVDTWDSIEDALKYAIE